MFKKMYSEDEISISCVAPNCQMRSYNLTKEQLDVINKDYSVSFHQFPTSPVRKNAWIRALGDDSFKPDSNSYLCDLHFDVDGSEKGSTISESIVPTIFFSNFSNHMKEVIKKIDTETNSKNLVENVKQKKDTDDNVSRESQIIEYEISLSDDDFEIECEEIKEGCIGDELLISNRTDRETAISTDENSVGINVTEEILENVVTLKPNPAVNSNEENNISLKGENVNHLSNPFSVPEVFTNNAINSGTDLSKLLSHASLTKWSMTQPCSPDLITYLLNVVKSTGQQVNIDETIMSKSNMFLIMTLMKIKSSKSPELMETMDIILKVKKSVASIKNLNTEKFQNLTIICASPAVFLMRNVLIPNADNNVYCIYIVTNENLIPFLQEIHRRSSTSSPSQLVNSNPVVTSTVGSTSNTLPTIHSQFPISSSPIVTMNTVTRPQLIIVDPKTVANIGTAGFVSSYKAPMIASSIQSNKPFATPNLQSRIPVVSINAHQRMSPVVGIQNTSNKFHVPTVDQFSFTRPTFLKSAEGSGKNILKLNLRDTTKIVSALTTNTSMKASSPEVVDLEPDLPLQVQQPSKPSTFPTITSDIIPNVCGVVPIKFSTSGPVSVSNTSSSTTSIRTNMKTIMSTVSSTQTSWGMKQKLSTIPPPIISAINGVNSSLEPVADKSPMSSLGTEVQNSTRILQTYTYSKNPPIITSSSKPSPVVSQERPTTTSLPLQPVFTLPNDPIVINGEISEFVSRKRHNPGVENERDKQEDEICEIKRSLDTAKFLQKQEFEIETFETNILRREREICSLKKQLKGLKKRFLSVRNPEDTKSDELLVEDILSKYIDPDGVQFFIGQMKVSGKCFSQFRWTEEDKLFALGLLYRSPRSYNTLVKTFALPSDKTLCAFVSRIKKAEEEN